MVVCTFQYNDIPLNPQSQHLADEQIRMRNTAVDALKDHQALAVRDQGQSQIAVVNNRRRTWEAVSAYVQHDIGGTFPGCYARFPAAKAGPPSFSAQEFDRIGARLVERVEQPPLLISTLQREIRNLKDFAQQIFNERVPQ